MRDQRAEIERALKQAQMYYQFWNQNRHLPTAAVTADYFAQRILDLERELNGIYQQDHADRQRGASARAESSRQSAIRKIHDGDA
tara:strand:- start:54 stop:308 length:255 start_codon:yes stop_codon:yes gene_type:complete